MTQSPAQSFPEVREAMRKLCADFPGEYWRALDRDRISPKAYVQACRTTPREAAARPSDGMSVLLVDMREAVGAGLTVRPVRPC